MNFLSSLEPSAPFYDVQVKGMAIFFFSFATPLVICLSRKMTGKHWKNLIPSTGNHLHHLPGLFYTDGHSSLLGEAPCTHFSTELCAVLCKVEMSLMGQ